MEDDDEFGDLYTDVLRPFQSSSTLHPPPSQSKQPSPNPPTDHHPHSDDEEIFFGASSSNPNPKFNFASSDQNQTLALKSEKEDFPQPNLSMVLESGGDVKLQGRSFGDLNLIGESAIDVLVEESDDKDEVLVNKDEVLMDKREDFDKFDIEEVDTGIGDAGPEPLIPGITVVSNAVDNRGDVSGEADDWDSDSEDDLQIVLNDSNHGPMTMEMGGVMGSDDEDEDGEPLVIVADSEPGHQPMEEQEWGEDAAQGMDGERKEGDAGKVNGGVVGVAPKLGYSSHVYHPYHSQFKYVRPGATPMPGVAPAGPGGAPGQVRPPVNMGPLAGRGRGDWRALQKSFHQGFGMPAWGNNTSVRGFGSGLDFTLPSHKTIFDIDVDSFEEKPWRLPGIDISDFFNFGLNEESWKDYCKQLEQLRLETTMQSKIRVYESGRTEQEYDPDLPPELAAAAGIHDITSENANHGKVDAGQSDVSKGSARVRPPLPTGRAIQVETGNGERLPSIDTRPPRMRDSDAIIEIVLQDSADDSPFPGNDVTEQAENDPSGADCRESREIEGDVAEKDGVRSDGFPCVYNDRKRELVGRATPFRKSVQDNLTEGDGILPSLPEAPVQYSPDSRGKSSAYPGRDLRTLHGERRTKGRPRDRSPNMTCSDSAMDKRSIRDDQKEDSVESIGGKSSPRLSSPVTVGSAEELDVEQGYGLHDELVVSDESSGADREEMTLATTASGAQVNENPLPSVKKQKLSSRVEQSSLQEIDDGGDFKAARSSENSKARSGSSRDYQQLRESVEKEAVQNDHSTRMRNLKRSHGDDERGVRGKGRDERHEMEKHRLVENVREDSYPRRDWDPYSAHHLHGKYEGIERRKERENSEGAWHRRDVDPHVTRARAEDAKKQECSDEIGSRHRNKARESERIDKDEHLQLRKQLDNGNLRGRHDRDVESRRGERNGNLKGRYEDMDDVHRKRRKEEEHLRDAGKEEILHGHRENTSRSKRDRDEALDLRKRDDQVRVRDDDRHLVRHKEEGWIHRDRGERQREQDELHKIKPSHEETLSKREREDGRGVLRSGRAADNKPWVSHARVKDDYKDSDRDYQFKDTRRHSEQLERRDRVENGYFSQHVGREDVHTSRNQLSNDDRRSRQERGSAFSDRGVSGSDNDRTRVKKHKETTRKSKESEGGDQNSMGPLKRNHENQSGQMNEPAILKGTTERGTSKHDILLNRHSSRKHREDASSDDEQQDSKRGRSKLERWTSHKERDFSIANKSSSSLKVKAIDRDNNGGSSSTSKKLPDESAKTVETITNQHPPGDEKDAGDPEIKNVDVKSMEDRHSDTVAKLKKRSERFKLPMPSEKEAIVIKKMESEPLPSAQSEARADSEIKPERPARKRRWISN